MDENPEIDRVAAIIQRTQDIPRAQTRGDRQLRDIIAEPVTNDDIEAQLELDNEYLIWTPIKHPDIEKLRSELGDPQPRSECFGCIRNIGTGRVFDSQALNDFQRLILHRGQVDDSALAKEMESFFEKNIREPMNRHESNSSNKLAPWTAASILDHFTNHINVPENFVMKHIGHLDRAADFLIHNSVYRQNKNNQEMRMHEKSLRMYTEVVKLAKSLRTSNTERMFLHNNNIEVISTIQPLVQPKQSAVPLAKKHTSMFVKS
jgi:hypothetical protein